MKFQEVIDLYAQVTEADRICRREYAVSDRMAAEIIIEAYDGRTPTARLHPRRADRNGCRHLGALVGELTPQELVRLAEIKAMVDQWVSGEIDDLPPSTSARFAESDTHAQRHNHDDE